MTAFSKFNCFVQDKGRKVHDLHNDDLQIYLSNEAPLATDTVSADIAEIATGNGYAGPISLTNKSYSQAAGLAKLLADDITITATGGSIGPFQYVILRNNTPAGDPLIGYWNLGSPVTLLDTQQLVCDFNGTDGILDEQ